MPSKRAAKIILYIVNLSVAVPIQSPDVGEVGATVWEVSESVIAVNTQPL